MPFTSLIATLAIAASCVSAQQITITALATDAAKVSSFDSEFSSYVSAKINDPKFLSAQAALLATMTDSSQLAQIASRVTDIAGAKSELSIQTAAATALLNEQQQAIIDDAKVVASIFNKYGSGASSEASTERASTFVGVALAAAIMGILIL